MPCPGSSGRTLVPAVGGATGSLVYSNAVSRAPAVCPVLCWTPEVLQWPSNHSRGSPEPFCKGPTPHTQHPTPPGIQDGSPQEMVFERDPEAEWMLGGVERREGVSGRAGTTCKGPGVSRLEGARGLLSEGSGCRWWNCHPLGDGGEGWAGVGGTEGEKGFERAGNSVSRPLWTWALGRKIRFRASLAFWLGRPPPLTWKGTEGAGGGDNRPRRDFASLPTSSCSSALNLPHPATFRSPVL